MKLYSVRLKAQEAWLNHWEHGSGVNHMLWERALDRAAVNGVPKPSRDATFWWKTREVSGGGVEGDIYSDASGLDGRWGVGRLGRAFAVVRLATAEAVAAASGVPPW